MFVRTASERDLAAVSRLIGESLHDSHDALYGAEMVDRIAGSLYSIVPLKQAMQRPTSEFLVADDGTAIVGAAFAAAADEEGRTVDVLALFVIPSLQSHGIGGMLLQELEESFFESTSIRVEVDMRNLRALGFLAGEGYAASGERVDRASQSTLVTLEKSLV